MHRTTSQCIQCHQTWNNKFFSRLLTVWSGDLSNCKPSVWTWQCWEDQVYAQNLKEWLKYAYDVANTASKFSQSRHTCLYDSKTKGVTLSTGDRVLVKVAAFDGKHKIADRCEDHLYIGISQPNPNIPVYKVSREDGERRCKTLHRNLLLPIGTRLPSPVQVPAPRSRVKQRNISMDKAESELNLNYFH